MRQTVTLKALLSDVRRVVERGFPTTYWVSADVSDVRENANGHCYLELVQKNDSSRLIEAKVRAIIMSNTYWRLKQTFFQATGNMLQTGMKVLVEVSVSFHELYGLSCVVQDIDPTFTIGDMARKRQETIARLKDDGVWDMNRQLELPELIRCIAVISSAGAAGYGDFCDQLNSNDHGLRFSATLFPAVMQGDKSAASVVEALDRIYAMQDNFDVVVIIRGGGAATDLLAFDEYELASCVAQFPLPVITGIGHERDESVTDLVAHTRCKTPTAVAAFIYEQMLVQADRLQDVEETLIRLIKEKTEDEKHRLLDWASRLSRACAYRTSAEEGKLPLLHQRLVTLATATLERGRHKVELCENALRHLSPDEILRRGYSITVANGKVVKNASQLQPGDALRTIFCEGEISSIVQ